MVMPLFLGEGERERGRERERERGGGLRKKERGPLSIIFFV